MQKKSIDLIIPFYNAGKTVGQTLASIAMQSIIDKIRVTVVDDNSTESCDKAIEPFLSLMDINLIRLDANVGPGLARQKGIDETKNPYIMFVDADDQLASKYSAEVMLNEMQNNRYNLLLTDFQEEIMNASPLTFSIHHRDMTWMFAKLYRRSVLEEYNVHFNPAGSYANEDSGFNSLLSMSISPDSIGYAQFVTYTWSKRPDSITRRENCVYNYTSGIEGFIKNQKYAIEQILSGNNYNKDMVLNQVIAVFATCYKTYAECLLSENHKDKLQYVMKQGKEFFNSYTQYLTPAIVESPFFRKCADLVPPHYLLLCSPYEFTAALGVKFDTKELMAKHRNQKWEQG